MRIRYRSPGSSPGIEFLTARPPTVPPVLSVMDFDENKLVEADRADIARCEASLADENCVTWVHVQGTPTLELLKGLGHAFGHHTLALEDILNLGQRPKVEDYDEELFVVLQHPTLTEDRLRLQQVSLFLGHGYLVSFHEGETDIFEPVRRRLRAGGGGRIRSRGADYLLYALLDLVVDTAFPVLDTLGDRLEDLEEAAMETVSREVQAELHKIRRSVIMLRRALGPHRDVLNTLVRDEHPVLSVANRVYLRDCYDHTLRIVESLETLRELILSTQEIYMSSLSNRMNDVMKVLTIIATIFIPLSFITGLYGMNFNTERSPWNMPELNSYFGYPVVLLILLGVASFMLWTFRRRDWF